MKSLPHSSLLIVFLFILSLIGFVTVLNTYFSHERTNTRLMAAAGSCSAKGGTCMNPTSCNGTVLHGLCPGGQDNKCCVDSGAGTSSSKSGNSSSCSSKGGACMNPTGCNGTVLHGLCPGGQDNKCCVAGASSSNSGGSACSKKGGRCYDSNIEKCGGTTQKGLCPGGNNIVCCVGGSTDGPNGTGSGPGGIGGNETACAKNNGRCFDKNVGGCAGTIKKGLCPGAANIVCCVGGEGPNGSGVGSGGIGGKDTACAQKGGRCFDSDKDKCAVGKTVEKGMCPGGSNIVCCIGDGGNTGGNIDGSGSKSSASIPADGVEPSEYPADLRKAIMDKFHVTLNGFDDKHLKLTWKVFWKVSNSKFFDYTKNAIITSESNLKVSNGKPAQALQVACPPKETIKLNQKSTDKYFEQTIIHELGHMIQRCNPRDKIKYNEHINAFTKEGGVSDYGDHASKCMGGDNKMEDYAESITLYFFRDQGSNANCPPKTGLNDNNPFFQRNPPKKLHLDDFLYPVLRN